MQTPFPAGNVTQIDVPSGHIASVITYLKRTRGPDPTAADKIAARYTLEWTTGYSATAYKQLCKDIGGPWLWYARLGLSDEALQSILDEPSRHLAILFDRGKAAGYVEIDAVDARFPVLSFLGLARGYEGRGLGQPLLEAGIARIWTDNTNAILSETCTLDHPGALGFYLKSGFVSTRRAIEVAPDPRMNGLLAPDIRPNYELL